MSRLSYLSSPPSLILPTDFEALSDLPTREAMHHRRGPKPSQLSYAALAELDDLRELDRLASGRR